MAEPFILLLKISSNPDRSMNDKIGKISEEPTRPLMISSNMLAIGVTWGSDAISLWNAVVKARITGVDELLIVQPTEDWCGMPDRTSSGWMTKHCGEPTTWGKFD